MSTSADHPTTPSAIARLQAVLREGMAVPRAWTIALALAAALSCVRVHVDEHTQVSGTFAPGSLAAILLALIWLPAVIRVLALAGGAVKTPAGEASTTGLLEVIQGLDAETKRDALPPLIAALGSAEVYVDPGRRAASRPLRRDLELQLAAASSDRGTVRDRLDDAAREYERVREQQPPGRDRTFRLTSLMAEARSVARATPLAPVDLRNMLTTGGDGDRAIALSLLQDQPASQLFDVALDAIVHSRSAFEQYQALGAMLEMHPLLSDAQRKDLDAALQRVLADPTFEIAADASRLRLVEALRDALRPG